MCAGGVTVATGLEDTSLERSQGELQVFFKPHLDRRSEQKIMSCQSLGSPNQYNFGTLLGFLLGSLGKKCHWDVGAVELCREYYMGEGGGFPRVQAVVSFVSPKSPVAHPSTKGAPESELTNLWLVGCRFE